MSTSLEITPELLAGFLDEAPEYLDTLDSGLLEFEAQASSGVVSLGTPEDQERMNGMFRAAHSLKGLAAAFGFDKIKELTHRMETLFDQVRMRKRDLTSRSFETLFRVFDRLKVLVQELSDSTTGPVEIHDLLAALDEILDDASPSVPAATATIVATSPMPAPCGVAANFEPGSTVSAINEIFADPELTSAFVETTVEAVEELNQGLLGLERSPGDVELLNKVFRCAHNIKGASGAAGLSNMNHLTHEMETVFDQLRNGRATLTEEMMNVIFATVDRLRASIEQIRDGHIADASAEGLIEKLRTFTSNRSSGAAADAPKSDERGPGGPVDGASGSSIGPNDGNQEDVLRILVRFPDGSSEAPIHAYLIHNKLTDLGEVLASDPPVDAIAGDSVLTTVTFLARIALAPNELQPLLLSYGAAAVEITFVADENAHHASTKAAENPELRKDAPVAMARAEVSQSTGESIPAASSSNDPTPKPQPAERARPNGASTAKAATKPDAPAQKTGETLRVDQERLDQLMNLGGELVINRARFTQVHFKFRNLFRGRNYGYVVDEMEDRLTQLGSAADALSERMGNDRDSDQVRSHLLHLNHSFQTVRSVLEQVHEARAAMTDFDEALHALGRVSEGLQKGIMGTRMVPVGPLFNRFRRVVRDISKSNGKQVELILKGENTELDKRMIDELGDPLTHMVRNSVDHGLEMPDVREAAGKNPVGTVILDAHHRGNSICIEVKDDGAGINLERVKAKVIEKELATPEQVQKLSDRELIQYILRPGFSTAPVVTDLSGRGMGMDIVVNKIEKLSGTIEIDSTLGEGTRITIKLPLTIAILTAMVARIGRGVYAVPLENVAEIITVHRSDIQLVQRREVVRVRERIVPVVHFEDVFGTSHDGLRTATRDSDEITLVLVGFENDNVGLVVDELLGQEDIVIKSMAENYRNVRGFAGASIRGDGTVSLILDVAAMMELAGKIDAGRVSRSTPSVLAGV